MLILDERYPNLLQTNLEKLAPTFLWNNSHDITEISIGALSSLDTYLVMSAFETQLLHSLRLNGATENSMTIILERLPRTDITTLTFSQSPINHLKKFTQSLGNTPVTTVILENISSEDAYTIMSLMPPSVNELILRNLSVEVTTVIASILKKTEICSIGLDGIEQYAVSSLTGCFIPDNANYSDKIFSLTLKNLSKSSLDIVALYFFNKQISFLNLSTITSNNITTVADRLSESNITNLSVEHLEDYDYIFRQIPNSRITVLSVRESHQEKINPYLNHLNGSKFSTLYLHDTSAEVTSDMMQQLKIWTQVIGLNLKQIRPESAKVVCQFMNVCPLKTLALEDISYDAAVIFCQYFSWFEKLTSLFLTNVSSRPAQIIFQTFPRTKFKLLQLRSMPDNSTSGLKYLKNTQLENLYLRELSPKYTARLVKDFQNFPIKVLTVRKLSKECCDIIAKNFHLLLTVELLSLINLTSAEVCEELCKAIKESKIIRLNIQLLDGGAAKALLSSLPPSLRQLHYSNLTSLCQQIIYDWYASSSKSITLHPEDMAGIEMQKLLATSNKNMNASISAALTTTLAAVPAPITTSVVAAAATAPAPITASQIAPTTAPAPTALTLLPTPSVNPKNFNNPAIFFAPAQSPLASYKLTANDEFVQKLHTQGVTLGKGVLKTISSTASQQTQTQSPHPQSLFSKPNGTASTRIKISQQQLQAMNTLYNLLNGPENKKQKIT